MANSERHWRIVMDDKRFESMLILIVPEVVKMIVKNYKLDEIQASEKFYNSELYAKLEQEETKLWHLSPLMLFSMFDEEQKTGIVTYPEEA